jgi:hypothetical protein
MAFPLIPAVVGIASSIGSSASIITVIKAVAMSFAVLAALKVFAVIIVGILSYSLIPLVLNNLPDLNLPAAVDSWTPGLLWAADLFALDQVLAITFTALNIRFVIRRFT